MAAKSVEQVLKAKKIGEITNPRLLQAAPDLPVKDAIQLMQDHKSGYIVVAKNKKAVGIFTETDIARKILGFDIDWNKPISEFMTKDPLVLKPDDLVGTAIDIMGERRFYHIPLVNEKGELVNVLSVRTLIRFLAEFYPTEVYNLPPRPDQVMETQEGG